MDEFAETDTIDHILDTYVGGSGFYQWRLLALFYPVGVAGGYPLLVHMFSTYSPPHRCRVAECESLDASVHANWTSFALPQQTVLKDFVSGGEKFDQCLRYPMLDSTEGCTADNFDFNHNGTECDRYVYDHSEFTRTLTTDLDLVCDSDNLLRLLGTNLMLGIMLGSMIGGKISDYFGRKKSIFGSLALIGPSLILAGFSNNFWMYAGFQLVWCSCIAIIWVCSHSLILEMFDARHRITVVCLKDLSYPIELMNMCLMAYFFRDWTHFQFVSGVLCLLPLVMWPFIPESVRWLAQNHKRKEAMDVFEKAAKANGRTLTEAGREGINNILASIEKVSNKKSEGKLSFWHMFRRKHAVKSLVLMLAWITTNVSSYTLSLNATRLAGNVFLNFFLAALAEMPASLILFFTLNAGKRKWNTAAFLILLSISCFILAFLPKESTTWILVVYLIGKCLVGACFQLVWLITAELYPTNLRGQAIGACSTVARIFGLVCPFVSNLASIWEPLPMVALGAPAAVAGILSLLVLPETSNQELPQNMIEATKLAERRPSIVSQIKHHHQHHHQHHEEEKL